MPIFSGIRQLWCMKIHLALYCWCMKISRNRLFAVFFLRATLYRRSSGLIEASYQGACVTHYEDCTTRGLKCRASRSSLAKWRFQVPMMTRKWAAKNRKGAATIFLYFSLACNLSWDQTAIKSVNRRVRTNIVKSAPVLGVLYVNVGYQAKQRFFSKYSFSAVRRVFLLIFGHSEDYISKKNIKILFLLIFDFLLLNFLSSQQNMPFRQTRPNCTTF